MAITSYQPLRHLTASGYGLLTASRFFKKIAFAPSLPEIPVVLNILSILDYFF